MNDRKALPKPFGNLVPPEEWEDIFRRIAENSPRINLFNGYVDMGSEILAVVKIRKKTGTLIIDRLMPDFNEQELTRKQPLLVRGQYLRNGLQHRISFNGQLIRPVKFRGFPALELEFAAPVQRVSNYYVAIPTEDRPVFLEIPVAGAPPEIRALEVSLNRIKAFTPRAKEIIPKPRVVNGVCIWFIDAPKSKFHAKISSIEEDEIEVELQDLPEQTRREMEGYINFDFSSQDKKQYSTEKEEELTMEEVSRLSEFRQENDKVKILVVDDEPEILQMMKEVLQLMNAEVITAADGQAALEIYHREQPDLVFSDIYMPRLNGIMLMNRLKEQKPDLPVVLFTGYANFRQITTNSKHKPDDFLPKPLSGRDLLKSLFKFHPELFPEGGGMNGEE